MDANYESMARHPHGRRHVTAVAGLVGLALVAGVVVGSHYAQETTTTDIVTQDELPVLRVGGIMQSQGTGQHARLVFNKWQAWVSQPSAPLPFQVPTIQWTDFNAITVEKDVLDLLPHIDVLVAPYTSPAAKKVIEAVPVIGPYKDIAILIPLAADDDLFITSCRNRNCFGTFTTASRFMKPVMDLVVRRNQSLNNYRVAAIANNNVFSRTQCTGAKDDLWNHDIGWEVTMITVADEGPLDEAKLDDVLVNMEPSVVVVCGHNSREQAAAERNAELANYIMSKAHKPDVLVAAHVLSLDHPKNDSRNGWIMPSQWGRWTTRQDDYLHWNAENLSQQIGQKPDYTHASAYGAAVLLTAAMQKVTENGDGGGKGGKGGKGTKGKGKLADALWTFNGDNQVETLYGSLGFNADGSTTKPMFALQQNHNQEIVVVGPCEYSPNTCSDNNAFKLFSEISSR